MCPHLVWGAGPGSRENPAVPTSPLHPASPTLQCGLPEVSVQSWPTLGVRHQASGQQAVHCRTTRPRFPGPREVPARGPQDRKAVIAATCLLPSTTEAAPHVPGPQKATSPGRLPPGVPARCTCMHLYTDPPTPTPCPALTRAARLDLGREGCRLTHGDTLATGWVTSSVTGSRLSGGVSGGVSRVHPQGKAGSCSRDQRRGTVRLQAPHRRERALPGSPLVGRAHLCACGGWGGVRRPRLPWLDPGHLALTSGVDPP